MRLQTDPPTIRPATPADLARITEIVERAYGIYVPRMGRRPGPMDHDYPERVRRAQVFVAESEAVLGLIVLIDANDHVLVENVAVDPDHQRQGVGRALMAYAEAHAAALGRSELRLFTNVTMTENRAMYLRFGYTETGRRNQGGFSRIFFRKRVFETGETRS